MLRFVGGVFKISKLKEPFSFFSFVFLSRAPSGAFSLLSAEGSYGPDVLQS